MVSPHHVANLSHLLMIIQFSMTLCVCVCARARVCVCEIDQKTILEPQACSENPFLFFKFTVGEYSLAATTSKYLANYGIIYRCYLQDIRQIFSCFQNISLSSSITTIIFGIAVLFLFTIALIIYNQSSRGLSICIPIT